jgi:hypothetical protein
MNLEDFYRLPRLWQWGGKAVAQRDGFVLGDDCTTFAASWVIECDGIDPASDLRGTYSTADEANAIVACAGGIAALIGDRIEPLGWARVPAVLDGDIGIVEAISSVDLLAKEIPAIRFGPLWIVMAPRGPMAKALTWTGVAWHRQ